MSSFTFAKMHGLGNDFMVLDGVTRKASPKPEQVRLWADRKTGVGFDQMLIVQPPNEPDADFSYRIFNADGSEAEQCGNGVRCVFRFVHDRGLCVLPELILQSAGGRVTASQAGEDVRVSLGAPATEPPAIPFLPEQSEPAGSRWRLDTRRGRFTVTPVSLGNPHGVVMVQDLTAVDVAEAGSALCAHAAFPEGANIGFCEVLAADEIRLRVFERGVGETRACGTGACAAVVAARLGGHVQATVLVRLVGGSLQVNWQGPGAPVRMTGDAHLVYVGKIRARRSNGLSAKG